MTAMSSLPSTFPLGKQFEVGAEKFPRVNQGHTHTKTLSIVSTADSTLTSVPVDERLSWGDEVFL